MYPCHEMSHPHKEVRHMYLQKMPSGVFHFRKDMPRDLTGIGYPCHIKISLLT
ncbi:hypothetical protein GMA8713_04218 [Grimontia marina]|uniref:Uncharacterized protein n=1 Tax=Grimontia marina TaxID=646534 RepID=A0A128FI64_9GAMM|nr:hypothetical protein GMA8713_04218 [Grimontia marina]